MVAGVASCAGTRGRVCPHGHAASAGTGSVNLGFVPARLLAGAPADRMLMMGSYRPGTRLLHHGNRAIVLPQA